MDSMLLDGEQATHCHRQAGVQLLYTAADPLIGSSWWKVKQVVTGLLPLHTHMQDLDWNTEWVSQAILERQNLTKTKYKHL